MITMVGVSALVVDLPYTKTYRDDGRLLAAKELLEAADLKRNVDERLKPVGSLPVELGLAGRNGDVATVLLSMCSTQQSSIDTHRSTYIRTVAPCEPVPDRRQTMREPSANTITCPWFLLTELSIGSV
jgi:hypothetical protein